MDVVFVDRPVVDPLDGVPLLRGASESTWRMSSMIGLRGAGHADVSAERTVRRLTGYSRAGPRTDRPARESRRIAGGLPSRPADAPTSSGGSGTGEHRDTRSRESRTDRQTAGHPRAGRCVRHVLCYRGGSACERTLSR